MIQLAFIENDQIYQFCFGMRTSGQILTPWDKRVEMLGWLVPGQCTMVNQWKRPEKTMNPQAAQVRMTMMGSLGGFELGMAEVHLEADTWEKMEPMQVQVFKEKDKGGKMICG